MVKARRVRWPDRSVGWYGIAGVVIVLDQASKWLVLAMILPGEVIELTPFWNWVLTFNAGAAFSFLADQAGWQRWFFTLLALAVSGWLAREIQRHATLPRLALAMALSANAQAAGAADAHHAHEHGGAAATLQLNEGKQWPTDAPLRQAMGEINRALAKALPAIHRQQFADGDYQALAATVHDQFELKNEASDLMYHLLVLLQDQGLNLTDVVENLRSRHK